MNCANHPDREKTAFCQNCGKPLCQECTRTVGTAVFCEPCLAARISGAVPPPAGGSYTYPGADANANYVGPGVIPPPGVSGGPNPAAAALLGIIPGVGAMYNGQFAKGIVHLVVFAILVSLADEHGIFGLFVAGWMCYQIIEAYHTAKARRDGTPLPNPFGLNDLGERMGFGKSWTAPSAPSATAVPPVSPADPAAASYAPPAAPFPPTQAPPQQRAPWDVQWTDYVAPAANPYMNIPPYDPAAPPAVYSRNRFPMGAIWLIGLGALFLIGNAGIFRGFPVHRFFPFLLIGFGFWLFIHKMTLSGNGLSDDGSAYYRMRLFSALRGSVWIILVGVMFLLSEFNILGWGRSWPLFIIVAGLMTIFERTSYSRVSAPYYPAPPAPSSASSTVSTSIVPSPAEQQDKGREEEGR
jgi:hypothetical protein